MRGCKYWFNEQISTPLIPAKKQLNLMSKYLPSLPLTTTKFDVKILTLSSTDTFSEDFEQLIMRIMTVMLMAVIADDYFMFQV